MKDYLQVQKDRIKYHIQPSRNTVHRSSLIAPNMPSSDTWISFINHFLIKRNYKSIALKISAIDKNGNEKTIKRIVIASHNLGKPSRSYLEKQEEKIDDYVVDYLESNGYTIVSSKLYEDVIHSACSTASFVPVFLYLV